MAEQEHTMIVFLNKGDHVSFSFDAESDRSNAGTAFAEMVKQGYLSIEFPDREMLIPLSSIQRLEITPRPPEWPTAAIRNARLLP